MLALASSPALAQVQRTFVNLGFEQPQLPGSNCYSTFSAAMVNGWVTNHPASTVQGSCVWPNMPNGTPIAQAIEFWRGPNMNGVPPRAGSQHVELNADVAARLSQTICLTAGERVDWSLSHRGRSGTDVMRFDINDSANTVARLSSNTSGGGGAPQCPNAGSVSSLGCAVAAGPNNWRDYSGAFIWNGTSGNHNFGFEAVSAAGGITQGNFLDEIRITLRPYLEFTSTTFTTREGQALIVPAIRISGTVPAGGITVLATITGGTATLGTDYTTASGTTTVNITIPAGSYDSTTFNLPITVITNDTLIENNETVLVQLQPNAAAYTLASSSACGSAALSQATLTIVDNDVDLRTTKSLASSNGGVAVFTVSYQNNTARPTVGTGTALQAHDATATIADALPAGFGAFAWTCAASGTPAPACPAASGTGAINASVLLPAGNVGATGGTLTYTITGTLAPSQCNAVTNTSTVTATVPTQEATGAQATFTTPTPGGTANNAASAVFDPVCADLSITKTNNANGVLPGVPTVYTLVARNAGPDAANGALVRDPVVPGLTCTTITCTGATGGASCPAVSLSALQGAGIAISPFPANSTVTLQLTCTPD